jgi:RNA polymerase sigma factor (TIGR02999 family)
MSADVTLYLEAIARGESQAAEDLLPLVYEELRRLATVRMAREAEGQTLQPTALVHEAWLRLVKEGDRSWHNRTHFFRAAALAMRRILVDRARVKLSQKRGAGADKVPIEEVDLASATVDERILLIDQGLERLEQEDPDSARVVMLKFFGGLTNKEVAGALGIGERSVERQWAYARACLLQMIQEEM